MKTGDKYVIDKLESLTAIGLVKSQNQMFKLPQPINIGSLSTQH